MAESDALLYRFPWKKDCRKKAPRKKHRAVKDVSQAGTRSIFFRTQTDSFPFS